MGERCSATWGSETPGPIELKFGMVDYVQYTTPHAKIGIRRFRGIGVGVKFIVLLVVVLLIATVHGSCIVHAK